MTAEIEAAAMPDQGATHQIATLVREFAGAPLQTGNDTSIKRTSFNRARERFAWFRRTRRSYARVRCSGSVCRRPV